MNLGVKHLPFISSNASWKSGDGVSGQFPAGLRVLVVDDDPTCLRILEKMLKNCLYEVTTSNRAEIALEFLRDNKNGYDIVISDVHMPDMDGFKLLERVGLEMDLPVIMMSADDSKNVVMKGVTHGACDYLIKPVRMEALKNIWQHVVRKKKHEWKDKDFEQSGSLDEQQQKPTDDVDCSSSANEGSWKSSKKRKEEEDEAEEREDTSTLKKPRVVWSVELHQQFVTAVNQLGIDKAVPKKILELMNVPGLTRENVASHLQKYRLYLRRLSGVSHHQNGLGNSFMGGADAPFGPMSSLTGVDLQALAASGQLPPQSLATIQAAALGWASPKAAIPLPLVNQRNVFGYENQNGSSKQANGLLHGIPTNMDSKQLATLHQSGFGSLNISQSNSLLVQMVQPQSTAQSSNGVGGNQLSNIPSSVGQPFLGRNGVDNARGPQYISISPVNAETDASTGFIPSYDVFNDLNQNRTPDWRLQNVGSTLERLQQSNVQGGLEVSPPVSIQNRFSANGHTRDPSNKEAFSLADGLGNVPSISQNLNSSFSNNTVRIKSERFPDTGFHTSPFPQRFGQEDLMIAILKQQQEGTESVENEFGYGGYHTDNLPG